MWARLRCSVMLTFSPGNKSRSGGSVSLRLVADLFAASPTMTQGQKKIPVMLTGIFIIK
jgi:hypothetical protein